jgi:CheY-like chemotaxis protein
MGIHLANPWAKSGVIYAVRTVYDKKCMAKEPLVFLIEDDTDDQEFFVMAVENAFPTIKCICADTGIDALEILKADRAFVPDKIFVDINMPRMDGMECLMEIKKIHSLESVPVYMYSTSAEPAIVKSCIRLGAAGFIKKEISISGLQRQLEEVMRNPKKE